ncbi:reverse transcriptase family protein [Desulfovibrio subterraneus]|uniref:reverse transcriptase domain-containing protein n=1 Tax=Desulfovibrio subterraneus TaxID=2718620 RepID=UPI0022B8ECED|nr:reverse transcriptase domain-containing protein [Desulfovibrio subterraneus]WBF66691.1 reverse transcriptase family protein [Desulfovibrio subterraneus]
MIEELANGQPTTKLSELTSVAELAEILGYNTKDFSYILFKLTRSRCYKSFEIPKKTGGTRTINCPRKPISTLQAKLYKLLTPYYHPKRAASGFIKYRSIVYGAAKHTKKTHLINIDIQDFFGSIHFGRIKGLLTSHPFNFNSDVATAIANISCYKDILPQGSPTSPLLSNMICWKLDTQLTKLAEKNDCIYTRYADDITFSTWKKDVPEGIFSFNDGKIALSEHIVSAIEDNGFTINDKKTRYSNQKSRMEVTGLTVNKKVNTKRSFIRKIRAILYDWDTNGRTEAEKNYINNNGPSRYGASIEDILEGKLAFMKMVKGEHDNSYRNMYRKFLTLTKGHIPAKFLEHVPKTSGPTNYLFGEGQTDWKHMYAAFRHFRSKGLFSNMQLTIAPPPAVWEGGHGNLKSMVQKYLTIHNSNSKLFFLFDTDDQNANSFAKGTKENKNLYHHHGNNIYTLRISEEEGKCIEHLYPLDFLTRYDKHNRRIYLSHEFDDQGKLKKDRNISYSGKKRFEARWINKDHLIDSVTQIVNGIEINIARSKKDFSSDILSQTTPPPQNAFDNFLPIFQAIAQALAAYESTEY